MQKSQPKFVTPVALALILALGVSACGKNMNLNLKNLPKATDPTDNGGGGGNPNGKNLLEDLTGNNTDATQKKDEKKTDAPVTDKKVAETDSFLDLDGKLTPLSMFDMQDPALAGNPYPYLNREKDAAGVETSAPIKHIGDEAGYVARNNLVFRAIKHVPAKEIVKSIIAFKLELKGVRLYNEKGVARNTLAKQVLCVLDTKSCTGQKAEETNEEKANLNQLFWSTDNVKSKDFSEKSVPVEYKKIQEAVLMSTESEAAKGDEIKSVELDLISAYGLKDKPAAEVIQWIMDNTTAFTVDSKTDHLLNYRKFRFVVANNVFIKEGQLVLQYDLKDDAKDKDNYDKPTGVDEYKNGLTDAADGSKLVSTPAVTETKKEEPKVEQNNTQQNNNPEQGKTKENATGNTGDKIIVPGQIVKIILEQPKTKEEKTKKADIQLNLYNDILTFPVGKTTIESKDLPKLGETARLIKSMGAVVRATYLTGHTSVTYPKKMTRAQGLAYNQKLGKARADKVASILVASKVKPVIVAKTGKVPEVSSCPGTPECPADRKVIVEISLSDELKAATGDSEDMKKQKEAELARKRDELAEQLRQIWETNTEISQ